MRLTCSVIITSHDPKRFEWVREAIDSVYSQTRTPDHVLFINNQYGMADKINLGVRGVASDVFIPLADDDVLDRTYLEKTLWAMEESGADIVYTDMELFGIDPRIVSSPDWSLENIKAGRVIPITSLIKRGVWEKSIYKSIDYLDWDFWWSAFENGFSACHLNEPLFKYRTHKDQWSRNCDVSYASEVVRKLHANS